MENANDKNYQLIDEKEEKGKIAEFNRKEATAILEQAGIGKDNPDYKRYHALTMVNVHNTRRFGVYNDDIKNNFAESLKNLQLDTGHSAEEKMQWYENASKNYYAYVTKNQFDSTMLDDETRLIIGSTHVSVENKSYYALVKESVQEAMKCDKYTMKSKQNFIDLLEQINGLDVSAEEKLKIYKEKYQSCYSGDVGTGAALTYRAYADSMNMGVKRAVQLGLEMRKETNPSFPRQFYDEDNQPNRRVILKLKANSAWQETSDYAAKNADTGLSFDGEKLAFISKNEQTSPGKFFISRRDKLEKFSAAVKAKPEILDMQDRDLFEVIKSGDFEAFKGLLKERGISGDKRNKELCQAIRNDADLFKFVGYAAKKSGENADVFMADIHSQAQKMDSIAKLCQQETAAGKFHKPQGDIDRIVFSVRPYDLATQSTFRDWESCMHVNRPLMALENGFDGGAFHDNLQRTIGAGSIVAYGYDSKNPSRMISRILIHPYENEKGQIVYIPNEKVYGEKNEAFAKTVNETLQTTFNDPEAQGMFVRKHVKYKGENLKLYNDGQDMQRSGHDGFANSFYYFNDFKKEYDFSNPDKEIKSFNKEDFSKKDKIIFADGTKLVEVKLPDDLSKVQFGKNMEVYSVQLPEGFHVPEGWTVGRSPEKPIDLSKLVIGNNTTLSGGIDIPDGFHVPDGCVLKGVSLTNSISYGKNITFSNASVFDFNVPDTAVLDHMVLDDIESVGKDVCVKNCDVYPSMFDRFNEKVVWGEGNTFKDVTLPEGFHVPDGSTLDNVKFEGKVTFGKNVQCSDMVLDGKTLDNPDILKEVNLVRNVEVKNANVPDGYVSRGAKVLDNVHLEGKNIDFQGVTVINTKIPDGCKISAQAVLDNVQFEGGVTFDSQGATIKNSSLKEGFEVSQNVTLDNVTFEGKGIVIKEKTDQKEGGGSLLQGGLGLGLGISGESGFGLSGFGGSEFGFGDFSVTIKNSVLSEGFVAPKGVILNDVILPQKGDLSQAHNLAVKQDNIAVLSSDLKLPEVIRALPHEVVIKDKETLDYVHTHSEKKDIFGHVESNALKNVSLMVYDGELSKSDKVPDTVPVMFRLEKGKKIGLLLPEGKNKEDLSEKVRDKIDNNPNIVLFKSKEDLPRRPQEQNMAYTVAKKRETLLR